MTNPYPISWIASCTVCTWQMGSYDRSRAEGAARVHPQLQPGHVATVEPVKSKE